MNDELRKVINFVIDNGIKRFEWNEEGMDTLQWTIENGKYNLTFYVYCLNSGNVSYSLSLFKDDKLVEQLSINDYLEINYKVRDSLLDKIRTSGVLND